MKFDMDGVKGAWEYVKDFCEDTAENLKDTVETAVDTAKLQYRIIAQRKELNAMYATLGRNLYSGANTRINADEEMESEEINRLCERITAKDEILRGLERQLRIVVGKVICPKCGRFMSDRFGFCPYCGRPMKSDSIEADFDEMSSDVTLEELDKVREVDDV